MAARTNGDDAVVIICGIDTPEDEQDNPVITGTLELHVKLNAGLQVPAEGDRVNLSGWFSYDDGSRDAAAAPGSTTPS